MPKMKKCTICGKSFLSCNGVLPVPLNVSTGRTPPEMNAGGCSYPTKKQAEFVQYAVKLLCLCTGNTAVQSAQKSHAAKIQQKTTGNTTPKIEMLLYSA